MMYGKRARKRCFKLLYLGHDGQTELGFTIVQAHTRQGAANHWERHLPPGVEKADVGSCAAEFDHEASAKCNAGKDWRESVAWPTD